MTSLQSKVDAAKAAVASTATCTSATSVLLKDLLATEAENPTATQKTAARATKATATARGKTTASTRAGATASKKEVLTPKEKAALAAHIINAALKSLTEASKPTPAAQPTTPCRRQNSGDDLRKPPSKRTLRRSNSMPMTPMQPRSLNRTSTSPITTPKPAKTTTTTTTAAPAIACLATVECLRTAFACLRSLQTSGAVTLPDLQLESGISSLVGKLVGLGLQEHALRELTVLKRRLDAMGTSTKAKAKGGKPTAADTKVKGLAELLDFGDTKFFGPTLGLVITTQTHVLRLMSATKKAAVIEAALPYLVSSCPTSPTNLLLESAKESAQAKTKAARQLDLLSQLLLSLAPNLSSKDDEVAVDSRLSCSPSTALELQALGLEARLHWWPMAGHKADVDKDIISPLSKCITSFIRRAKSDPAGAYRKSSAVFDRISVMAKAQRLEATLSSKSPLTIIYQALGTAAQTARSYKESAEWISKIKGTLDPASDSAAKCCAVAAQLVAVYAKQTPLPQDQLSTLLQEVADALQGSLKGDVTELEELMVNLSAARRSVVGILASKAADNSEEIEKLLNNLVLQFPRFAVRWLGKAPTRDASPKEHVRHESRRQILLASVSQILDSALMVAKSHIDNDKMAWGPLDTLLQECLMLLESMGDINTAGSKADAANSHHVKLSHLYFMFFHWYRRNAESKPGDKTLLRALRRSVDCVKDRSSEEKEKAQTTAKLEYFADLCERAGRINDARDALKLICTNMVEDGVLAAVATSLSERSPAVAWSASLKAETLSRTLGAMVKLDQSWNDWTFFLADVERGAVLERIIQLILSDSSSDSKPSDIKDPVEDALLRIYSPDRFPIRRLRTLSQLLTMAIGNRQEFQSLREQTEAALQLCRDQSFGEDGGLASYVPDLEAGLSSTLALVASETEWRAADFDKSISVWRALVNDCQTKDDLLAKINDAEGLLRQLNAVAEYAKLKGEDEFLLSVLTLSADVSSKLSDSSTDLLVQAHSKLADQYTHLGYSEKAEEILNKAKQFVESTASSPDLAAVNLHISFTEYQLANQNSDAAHKMLLQGEAAFEKASSAIRKAPRLQRKLLLARAACLSSRIKWDKGEYQHALFHAKTSVRILYQDWTKLEARWQKAPKTESNLSSRQATPDAEESMAKTEPATDLIELSDGPDNWALACGLLRAVLHLSSVYAHLGMFQETVYYAEKAHQIANSTNASIHRAQAASWIGSVWIKACKLDKSIGYLNEARQLMATAVKPTRQAFQLACELSASFGEMKDHENEHLLLELAEVTLGTLNNSSRGAITGVSDEQVVTKMAKLTLKAPATRRTRATKAAAPAATRTTRRVAAPKTKAAAPSKAVVVASNDKASDLKASMLMYKALVHLSKGDWAAAASLLEEAKQMSSSLRESLRVQIGEAICLIEQGTKQMEGDSVFSVVKESTISYPSIHAALDKNNTEKTSPTGHSPRKAQGRAASAERKVSKDNATFVETLEQAQTQLMEAQAAAAISGNGHLVHRISALLQSTGIFLSAASQRVPKNMGSFGYATCSVEFARNLTWKRERNTVVTEQLNPSFSEMGWPLALPVKDDRRASIITVDDMTRFQRDYVDVIPEAWSVLSISLSDNRKDLCITKLRSGQTPFVLRLPLERVASRDGEDELFDFQHGYAELMDIIKATNASCHNAGDYTAKGAKSGWWAQRENLDNRFKDLLDNVEQIWLGGFKGIFSQHRHRADLLAKFQKAFSKILDKHLPSRRQVRGKKTSKTPKIALEPRVLDLFVGLGDPSAPDSDLEEPLNDLLYFVVDILQFHGERNAYDEIDFDSMVLDTFDALQAYHTAAKTSDPEEGAHSILILDKALHAFPWESLPCMEGLAYSRVPSLSCLRRLLLEQRAARGQDEDTKDDRHTVSPLGGTYILNPGSDLKNTLATFEKPLKTLGDSWTGIVSRKPTEDEFEGALKGSDIVLYFGHGSGAQYIRGKTIRRLEKCKAAALLMGCSSASLQNAGEYECHGPVWNYMLAGCPAVVGTLWDVTDKDIDRYAGRLFEEWGLMDRGTFVDDGGKQGKAGKGKGKGKDLFASAAAEKKGKGGGKKTTAPVVEGESPKGGASLVEAVARARDACRFRYITAGAVCVYGIPVYVDKAEANGA
ncbi:cell division-associated protein bimB (peptidase family C50) [Colletotrichum tofieldiae]|uniref:separase n=1 Tax=Colletotrichum tofieldiae TaxID=708197 RepID=A0A166TUB3_9PEZI|nr:cell division-associated protein bimB (peptidase family C50) [Colletotrichum tofieldiae]GKT87842.1 cell division-associated protein bimB [Colletotrichum tofieldiae]